MRKDSAHSDNRRTIASYDECALEYAQSTKPEPGSDNDATLARFLEVVPAGRLILEVGSGPGWDADWLERQGVHVRRTDASTAFIEIQAARGATAELLDVVTDDLGGPYAGFIARYVFQHIDRWRLPGVLAKIAAAIVEGGAFLFSLREGHGERIERGSSGGEYYVAEWAKHELDEILGGLGFRECWSASSEDADGRWLTILTTSKRVPAQG
jgi:SAM-dependent methyltransferase